MITPRRTVLDIEAYRPPLEGRRGKVRLDFNENTAASEDLSAYPEYATFLERLSASMDLPEKNLLLTNGTGEAIWLVAFTFIEPGRDKAVASDPTFALIPHNLKLAGADLKEVPATKDWLFDTDAIERELAKGAKLAFFASPDNPTGATLSKDTVRRWCASYPGTLFVIDEAYAEYSEGSSISLIGEFDNILVLRTFSKAWGMAALRLGVIAGPERLLNYMLRVRAPYSVNTAAMNTAIKVLPERERILSDAKTLLRRRGPLQKKIEDLGWGTYSNAGNFFLMMAGIDAPGVCSSLSETGVLVRDQSLRTGMNGIVRVTVGTETENERLVAALSALKKTRAVIFDLDDTLVDTSKSYDATVAKLVERYSGRPLDISELKALRNEGGFNDDWEATSELLKRRGVTVPIEELARNGIETYLPLAKMFERLMIETDVLSRLAKRYRLFVLTGRTRQEYEPVWARELGPFFENVYCSDDLTGLKLKPAPDMAKAIISQNGLAGGLYIGNSVDDMRCAKDAGLTAVGVSNEGDGDLLLKAGATKIMKNISDIKGAFML